MANEKTLTSLITEAQALIDETYNAAMWVDWFNNGLDDLAPYFYVTKKVTITETSTGSNEFTLPADMLALLRVDGATANLPYLSVIDDETVGYKIIGDNMVLQGEESPTLSIIYYRRPAYLSTANASAALDIPQGSSSALVNYACLQAMLREDEPDRISEFTEKYENAKAAIMLANKKRRPGYTGVIQVVR